VNPVRFIVLLLTAGAPFALGQATDWPSYNGDLASTRYSALKEITPANVGSLKPACNYDTGETIAFQSGLVMTGGTIYFTTFNNTYAIDASTCALQWKYNRPDTTPGLGVNRGIAYLNGKLFRGAAGAHLIAIDAATGKPGWEATLGDAANGDSAPLAPIAWTAPDKTGMVFAGNAGGDNFGVTGHIFAFSADDGHELWHFNVVPESGPARKTWKNLSERNPPTGGATWTTYSLDTDAGILWVSTGNVAPDFLVKLHPGTNLYTTSVVALDARTGKFLRYVQPVKKDFHDWDMTSPPALIRTAGGRMLAAAAGKDGMLYAIDRSGVNATSTSQSPLKIEYATPVTTRTNVKTPLNAKTETHFCPGTQGGTEWNGPAFHPALNTIFVNAVDWCASVQIADAATVTGKRGAPWAGSGDPQHMFGRTDPKEMWGGWLTAIDADTGKVRWKYKSPTPMVAAVTPTAGGLVFTGDLNGDVVALDASMGSVLWKNATGAPLGGGVISYETNGHQRIAVAAGMSPVNWPLAKVTARVIVYALP
jgi:alcohol dehydrogenase (cytochrome c)